MGVRCEWMSAAALWAHVLRPGEEAPDGQTEDDEFTLVIGTDEGTCITGSLDEIDEALRRCLWAIDDARRPILPSDLTDEDLIAILEGGSESYNLAREDTGPGKFEGNANPGLAAAIYERSLEGSWHDEETGTVEWGHHVYLMGRFLLIEDDHGFVTLEEHAGEPEAREAFDEFDRSYSAWEASDD